MCNAWENPLMDYHHIQARVEVLLVTPTKEAKVNPSLVAHFHCMQSMQTFPQVKVYSEVSHFNLSLFIVYKDQCFGYFQIVRDLAQKSMADARREVQATNNYITNGDVS